MDVHKLILGHVELTHVLDLAVHLVNFVGWMGKGHPSKIFSWLFLFNSRVVPIYCKSCHLMLSFI